MRSVSLALLLLAVPSTTRADDWYDRQQAGLLDLYRHLHSHPELSFKEVETAKRVAEELRKAGAEVTTGVGKTGVVGLLRNGEGPTVMVRTDLDALPVVEQTGLPFASRVTTTDDEGKAVGVMHACGHDVHMTCLVGTARWLADHKSLWRGTVVFIGQPAEEKIGGAKAMLADGLYTRFPRPDFALALHVAHELETGKVAYTSGPAMASSTSIDILVRGKGGHGARPQDAVDPIVLASALVLDLQTIVSREVDPIEPAVVTVGAFHAGSKHNIIPAEARLQLTIRSYKPEVRSQILGAIERKAKGSPWPPGPEPSVTIGDDTPPTINTPSLVDRVLPSLRKAVGDSNVLAVEPTMGAEDFGLYATGGVPIFMFRLGTIPPEQAARAKAAGEPLPSIHSPQYKPDAPASLPVGIRAMTTRSSTSSPPK
jgi:hippurate hydrolase